MTGSVAEEDAVPKAVVKAFAMLAMNLKRNSSQTHQCLQIADKAFISDNALQLRGTPLWKGTQDSFWIPERFPVANDPLGSRLP